MGVKSFITRAPFHERFLSTITRPNGKLDKRILAPPLTSNCQLVGIAFDYLLRFYVERINAGSKTSVWAAEEGVMLLDPLEGTSDKYETAKSHLDGARKLYKRFIQDGCLTDELISAALGLAHLEGTRRSGAFNEADVVRFDERDIADLRKLMSLVREQDFSSRKACYLNPTFGSTGSNADLIIDDKLIDIKTTKHIVLDRRDLHQLVHYYILLSLKGIDVGRKRHINYFEEECEVNQICIYFSRYGYLHPMKIADLINPEVEGRNLPAYGFVGRLSQLHDDMVLAIAYFSTNIHSVAPDHVAYMPRNQIRLQRKLGHACNPACSRDGVIEPRRDFRKYFDADGIRFMESPDWQ